jgi:transcriptional regulator with XRE-family HTH domain
MRYSKQIFYKNITKSSHEVLDRGCNSCNSLSMAQRPAKRHVIANVRIEAGFSQMELASVLDCAAVTVQRIEQGTLALSEELAIKAQEALNVSAAWLLANNPNQPAVTPEGGLWNKLSYEFAAGVRDKNWRQAAARLEAMDKKQVEDEFDDLKTREAAGLIRAMLAGARGSPKHEILVHRLQKKLEELKKDFRPDKKVLEEELKRELQRETARLRDEKDASVFRFFYSQDEEPKNEAMEEHPGTKSKNDKAPKANPSGSRARRRPGRA